MTKQFTDSLYSKPHHARSVTNKQHEISLAASYRTDRERAYLIRKSRQSLGTVHSVPVVKNIFTTFSTLNGSGNWELRLETPSLICITI